MRGKIEGLQLNTLGDGRQYMTVQIEGQKYSLWDNKYFEQLQEGMEISYKWKESGNFKNLTEVDLNPALNLNSHSNPGNNNNHQYDRDRHIARLACLKSASKLLASTQIEPEKKKELAIEYASEFVNRFVYGGQDLEESDIPF